MEKCRVLLGNEPRTFCTIDNFSRLSNPDHYILHVIFFSFPLSQEGKLTKIHLDGLYMVHAVAGLRATLAIKIVGGKKKKFQGLIGNLTQNLLHYRRVIFSDRYKNKHF